MFPRLYLLDRYILRAFLRTLAICFTSFTGLFIVIDLFGNLEEFIHYIDAQGPSMLLDYYGPRVLTFFDQTNHLLALIASMFVVTWMQRTNEITAVMAAGIPKRRVVQPLIMAGCALALLAAVNREIWIPRVRAQLTRNAQTWSGHRTRKFTPMFDFQTRILFTGQAVIPAKQLIEKPILQLPNRYASFGTAIVGREAQFVPASEEHPAGYLIRGVTQPRQLAQLDSIYDGERPVILTPKNAPFLRSNELFVVSTVSFEELALGRKYRRYLSTWELIQSMRNPSLDYGAETRVMLHARFVQPLLDVCLLILGLPLVTRRNARNVFLAGGLALLLVLGFLATIMAAHAAGSYLLIRPPALAAWLPLFVFGPAAFVALRHGWE